MVYSRATTSAMALRPPALPAGLLDLAWLDIIMIVLCREVSLKEEFEIGFGGLSKFCWISARVWVRQIPSVRVGHLPGLAHTRISERRTALGGPLTTLDGDQNSSLFPDSSTTSTGKSALIHIDLSIPHHERRLIHQFFSNHG